MIKNKNSVLVTYNKSDQVYYIDRERNPEDRLIKCANFCLSNIVKLTPLDGETPTVVVTSFSDKKLKFVNVNNKDEFFIRDDYEHVLISESAKRCHRAVSENVMDISEGGLEKYMAIDIYDANGSHLERGWYSYNEDSMTYDLCSEPEHLKGLGIFGDSEVDYPVTSCVEVEKPYGFYKI